MSRNSRKVEGGTEDRGSVDRSHENPGKMGEQSGDKENIKGTEG
jgi:hypothetical protein